MQIAPQKYETLTFRERAQIRQAYAVAQDGNCYHCGAPLSQNPADEIQRTDINWRLFPSGFTKHPIHLHHSHTTGMTIGAVHARCNAVLWQYYGE